jgi:arylsulfatase A
VRAIVCFVATTFGICFWSNVATAVSDREANRPNIIILLADDLGWGDLGCQGHPYAKTPAIDGLAESGCRLTQFYVTAPVCSPSRAGLLTGRIQNRFGMKYLIRDTGPNIFHHVPLEEPSLPRLLRSAGYTTAHIGKWHLSFVGREGEPSMADYGYDYSMILAASRNGSYKDSKWQRNGDRTESAGSWTANIYVDEAVQFIERAGDQPFFINLWNFAPHQEVECDERFRDLYADRTESEQYFYGTVSQMDEQYGRLLKFLDEKHLAENTIVIFSSDNGPEPHLIPWSNRARGSTGGLRGGKHHLFEGGIRVPGIVRWPGVTKPGSVISIACWTADMLPTLCAAADAAVPKEFPSDGVDIRAALRGEQIRRNTPLFWQFLFGVNLKDGSYANAPGLALRDGCWKLHCDTHFESALLYNIDIDPNEKWNMVAEYPDIAERLLQEMRIQYAGVNGPHSKTASFINPQMSKSAEEIQ